ncbi:MFS transporter [Corynebacterium sp. CNCTC7651]|nr:MFS transporter [Corynebacterium sp. CNCTC7651]
MPHSRPDVAKAKANPWNTLAALAAGYFCVLFDQGFMPVVTPLLPYEVNSPVWLTSIFLLCSVAPMPAAGRLGDAYGQRRLFLLGLGLAAFGLLLAGASWSFGSLVVARAVQGTGVALFLPQAFALIPQLFDDRLHGRAFAVWGVVGSAASLLGPVLGGAIVGSAGWRAGFFVQAFLCAVSLVAAAAWVPQRGRGTANVPVIGMALSFGSLGALVHGIQFGSWSGILIGAIGLAVLVLAARNGTDRGFLPLALLRNRTFALGTFGVTAMGFTVASMFIPLMYWLQTVAGATPSRAGMVTVPMSVVAMIATPVAGRLTDSGDPRALCVAGFVLQAAGLGLVAGMMFLGMGPWWFAGATAIIGLGSAFVWAPNAALTLGGIPDADAGAASGLYNTARQVGSVLGVAATGAVLAAGEVATTAPIAVVVPAAAMVLGAVSAALLPSRASVGVKR